MAAMLQHAGSTCSSCILCGRLPPESQPHVKKNRHAPYKCNGKPIAVLCNTCFGIATHGTTQGPSNNLLNPSSAARVQRAEAEAVCRVHNTMALWNTGARAVKRGMSGHVVWDGGTPIYTLVCKHGGSKTMPWRHGPGPKRLGPIAMDSYLLNFSFKPCGHSVRIATTSKSSAVERLRTAAATL